MQNEYHQKVSRLQRKQKFKGQQWFGKRKELVEEYSWAVPNNKVLAYIGSAFDTIAEIGAGSGYWAHLLQDFDVDVRAFDKDPSNDWYEVEARTVSQIPNYIEDNPVLMVWPPANDPMAADVLDHRPSHVLYVGEPQGGCTASDEFFEQLNKFYGPVKNIDIPSYAGVEDNFYHYVRKT